MSWTDTILTLGRGPVDSGPEFRREPELVTLEVREGVAPSPKPAVRIFLGSEPAQYRAERVFVYSVEKYRDPGRIYEIYIMKDLRGFSRRRWRTNFTNYRFAIPDFAGRAGRAIYNDVDQIYLADPGELFDLDMDGHGYMSVSAEDTSVMLIDCQRMAEFWNRELAQSYTKSQLLALASNREGLWGELDGAWNARDMAEYHADKSKCLHFTALHTQPWCPTPEQYSYHGHPLADLWYALEDEADADGFTIFSAKHPSQRYVEILNQHRLARAEATDPEAASTSAAAGVLITAQPFSTVLECSLGSLPGACDAIFVGAQTTSVDLAQGLENWPGDVFDWVAAANLLERLPADDVSWMLDELFRRARRGVYVAVRCGFADRLLPDGGDLHACVRSPSWWREQVVRVAQRYPGLCWHLDAAEGFGRAQAKLTAYQAGPRPKSQGDPKVWVLLGSKGGDNAQLINLAQSLGWSYDIKRLVFNQLHACPAVVLGASLASLDVATSDPLSPPWPDVVLAAGKRSVPVARWINARSKGSSKLVHIGRPWAPLEWFDLIITTPQYGLPARPNILHNTLPLNTTNEEDLRLAAQDPQWSARIDVLAPPRIAVLVGGNSSSHLLTTEAATRLAEMALNKAAESGGSLMVTTSPRTPREAADALEAALGAGVLMHRWHEHTNNPYKAFLARADAFIVTGDSASMVAEACSRGKPVTVFPVPERLELIPAVGSIIHRFGSWRGERVTYRGTPKQQDAIDRLFDKLVDAGIITPARDLDAYRHAVETRVLANGKRAACPNDMDRAVARIHRLITSERQVA